MAKTCAVHMRVVARYSGILSLAILLGPGLFGCGLPVDPDGDGYSGESGDCRNDDPEVYPGALEVCDPADVDEDCNGLSDDADPGTSVLSKVWFFADQDADGFGNPESALLACDPPEGFVRASGDCDDLTSSSNPDALEVCGEGGPDGEDNDCDGRIDENDAVDADTWYIDQDGDGYGRSAEAEDVETAVGCTPPPGYVDNSDDCDDTDPRRSPGLAEQCDEVDNDCDGTIEAGEADGDGDGFRICEPEGGGDCDDGDPAVHPGATETCDQQDNNCDGEVDEPLEAFDALGDGTLDCVDDDLDGYTETDGDCDDLNRFVYPGAPEVGDGRDNDCDGQVDEDVTAGVDADEDGFVWPEDCDDADSSNYPGAIERCDDNGREGVDNDCDGLVDEPGAEGATTCYIDYDHDDFGSDAYTLELCECPEGYVESSDDCDDTDPSIHPGAREDCEDGIDNNCNGATDGRGGLAGDSTVGVFIGPMLLDSSLMLNGRKVDEGAGAEEDGCSPLDGDGDGFSEADGDCDDDAPSIYPGADEVCDGVDTNCDGDVDPLCGTSELSVACVSSGGTWQEEACGHYVCGEPEELNCFEPSGGCDCGAAGTFDPEVGCVTSEACGVTGPPLPTGRSRVTSQ